MSPPILDEALDPVEAWGREGAGVHRCGTALEVSASRYGYVAALEISSRRPPGSIERGMPSRGQSLDCECEALRDSAVESRARSRGQGCAVRWSGRSSRG